MNAITKARANWSNRTQHAHGSVIPKLFRPPYAGTGYATAPYRWEMAMHFRHWVYISIAAWMREVAGGDGPKLGNLLTTEASMKRMHAIAKTLGVDPRMSTYGMVCKAADQGREDVGDYLRWLASQPSYRVTKSGTRPLKYPVVGQQFHARRKAAGPKSHEEFDPWQHDHPMVQLLDHPNGLDCAAEFWAIHTMFFKLTGESHWWVIRNELDIPVELWVIPTQWKRGPYIRSEGQEPYYTIQAPWGVVCDIPCKEVTSFFEPSPLNRWEGFGVTQAMSEAIDAFEQLTRSRLAVWINNGTPSMHIQLGEGYGDPDDAILQRFYAKWNQRFGGSDNSGRPIITGPDITLKGVEGHRPADMLAASNESEVLLRDEILAAFGVPKAIVGLTDNLTYGSVSASIDAFREYQVNAFLTLTGQKITQTIIRTTPQWQHGICYWEDRATGDSEFRLNKQKQDLETGVRTVNEVRTEDGLPAYELGGNNPRIGGEEVPYVEEISTPAALSGQEEDLQEMEPPPDPTEGLAQRPDGMVVSEQPKSLRRKRVVKVQTPPSNLKLSFMELGGRMSKWEVVALIDGEEVGSVKIGVLKDGTLYPVDTYVDPGYRRQGIASAMYDYAERELGKRLGPGVKQSEAAQSLWQDFRRREVRALGMSGATGTAGGFTIAPQTPLVNQRRRRVAKPTERVRLRGWSLKEDGTPITNGKH